MSHDHEACFLCHDPLPPGAEEGVCSTCGFAVDRITSHGYSVVSKDAGSCDGCLHAAVCRLAQEAKNFAATISLCLMRMAVPGEEESKSSVQSDIDELLQRCKDECGNQSCNGMSFQQRVTECSRLASWATAVEQQDQ